MNYSDIDMVVEEPDVYIVGSKKVKEATNSKEWKDKMKRFGCLLESPKRETGIFYNELLPVFYKSFWPYRDDAKRFKMGFDLEKKRQWEVNQEVKQFEKSFEYIFNHNNPACYGKFKDLTYSPKVSDHETLKNILISLQKLSVKVKKSGQESYRQSQYLKNAKKIKSGYDCHHDFCNMIIQKMEILTKVITDGIKTVERRMTLIPSCSPVVASSIDKKRKYRNEWRKKDRKRKAARRNSKSIEDETNELFDTCCRLYQHLVGGGDNVYIFGDFLSTGLVRISCFEDGWEKLIQTKNEEYALRELVEQGAFIGEALDAIEGMF